jgi:N6-adenosine-specific RNA methylase IME4
LSFQTIVCDAPWKFADKLPGVRGAESHYDCMSTIDLMELRLPPIADDAILFNWCVAGMLEDAVAVTNAWGFKIKSSLVWVKTVKGVSHPEDECDLAFGMGRTVRAAHETCLIATKGKYSKLIKNHNTRSVFFAERGKHSAKPDEFYVIVEKLCEGPYLELFARTPRSNWTGVGKELGEGTIL